jgi:hypothetical protein
LLLFQHQIAEHRRELLSETARLSDGFQLPIDVLGVPLLSNAYGTYDHNMMFGINSVNDTMVSELVFPIVR